MKIIIEIFLNNKWRILLVYAICIFANSLWVLEPYILGRMIDGILENSFIWTFIFILVNLVFIGFGYIRRVFDTKVFSKLYNEIVLKYISNSIDKTETSKIIARTEMSKSLISFLEDTVPIILSVIFATVGSLAAVYLMSPIAALIICFILIPVFFVIQYFYKKTKKMTFISNSNDELHVEKIQSGNLKIIFDYFTRRRRILIMNSTLNAKNYFAFDFLALFFILTTLIYFITTENSTTGDAIAFYGYINRFAYSLGGITYVINMVVQIRDISKRIE